MRIHILKTGIIIFLCICLFGIPVVGCSQSQQSTKPTIRFIEADWTSQLLMTEIVSQIVEKQLGYPTERIQTSVTAGWAAISRGDADISAEIWLPSRQSEIQPYLDNGTIEIGSEIFPGIGGWFTQKWVIEGDTERGIEPQAPDMETFLDLKDVSQDGKGYWKLYENPEQPGFGELVGGSPGWADDARDRIMIRSYDLPLWRSNQSEAVMMARMIAADKKGEPLLMYLWSPHWLFAEIEMVKLGEPDPWYEGAFADETKNYKAGHPSFQVHTAMATRVKDSAPDVFQLLQNITVGEETANTLMLRVDISEEDIKVVAADWIQNNQTSIDQWLGR